MARTISLVAAVIVAVAAAGFAWQRNQALEEARAALSNANAQLQKTQADLRALGAVVEPLRKEVAELKSGLEQQRAELGAARAFLESERAATARVREELALAKEQIAFMARSRAAQPTPAGSPYAIPMPVRAPPPAVRVAPSSLPTSVGVGVRAQ